MKILLIGSTGKLGQAFEKVVLTSSNKGSIVGKIHSNNTSLLNELMQKADIILDVSSTSALKEYLPLATSLKKPLVTGVTGYVPEELKDLKKAAQEIPILHMSNFSEGIAILKALLPSLPEGSYSIVDAHHKNKKDSPSGTALDLAKHLPSSPKIESIREGDTIGEHTITLTMQSEEISISHKVHDRKLFAEGALKACCFLYLKEPGLYNSYYDQGS